jgi:hypothetical protein
MVRVRINILILLLLPLATFAQDIGGGGGYRNNRIMGFKYIMPPRGGIIINNFNNLNEIDTFHLYRSYDMDAANISNEQGQLLFHTNGSFIAGGDGLPATNGDLIGYDPNTSIYYINGNPYFGMCVALFYPGNDSSKYILVHTSVGSLPSTMNVPNRIFYSVVEIDSNLHANVVQKNITLLNDTFEGGKLTACKHGNGRDWWVLIKERNQMNYFALLVTPDSIYTYKHPMPGPYTLDYGGQVCFSNKGDKYAIYDHKMKLRVYDFNRCTGELSNLYFNWDVDSVTGCAGVSFSPSDRYLYVNTFKKIERYDMQFPGILGSRETVANWDSLFDTSTQTNVYFFTQYVANDGKIYIQRTEGNEFMSVIEAPDEVNVSAVNFNTYGSTLPRIKYNTTTNHPNYFLGPDVGCPCDTLGLAVGKNTLAAVGINIFPNPNHNGIFTLNYDMPRENNSYVYVRNMEGKIVHEQKLAPWSNTTQVNLPNTLANGMYAISVIVDDRYGYTKLVLNK